LAPEKGEKGEKTAPCLELLIEKTATNTHFNLNLLKPPKVIGLPNFTKN
jgi:hypothetical protein